VRISESGMASRSNHATSCGAADSVKPKASLRALGYDVELVFEPRSGDRGGGPSMRESVPPAVAGGSIDDETSLAVRLQVSPRRGSDPPATAGGIDSITASGEA
jgi:hypothetical protein